MPLYLNACQAIEQPAVGAASVMYLAACAHREQRFRPLEPGAAVGDHAAMSLAAIHIVAASSSLRPTSAVRDARMG